MAAKGKGKRQAETTIASKSKKISRLQEQKYVEKSDDEQQEGEGLFDNLDEEMDPNELENIMQQLNEQDSQEEDEEEDEEEDKDEEGEDEDEEDETNEFNDIESEELQEEEEEKKENSPSESEEEEEEEDVTMEEQTPIQEHNTAKKFRDYYMTKMTQAFGTDLDQIRQEPTLRVNVLIDSLEAGINIYSTLEQEIILADEQ